ncbi:hypothetical protein [Actinoplanes sp. DH11]|uniref:hypothetical protein n=1 Tax=Actinoplanes sp. DH11 TaxID=2857011 RepID=UPI001E6071EC|nr:hypothetical protein [Actinoplanes sp. DH11]
MTSVPHQNSYATPFPEDPTTATRHLCAAAYLDEDFRNTALREVYHQPRRAVAPSYGFNLGPVLGHCLRARTVAVFRDAAILLVLIVSFCAAGTAFFTAVATLAGFYTAVATARLIRDLVRSLRDGTPIGLTTLIARLLFAGLGLVVTISVASLFVTALSFSALSAASIDGAATSVVATLGGGFLIVTLLAGCSLGWTLWRQAQLQNLRPGMVPASPVEAPRLREIEQQQYGNTVIYGDFRPFVGAGDWVDTWGSAIRLTRPPAEPDLNERAHGRTRAAETEGSREFEQLPFQADEVLAHLGWHLGSLVGGPGTVAGESITGLTVTDRVLLAGTEVSHLHPMTSPHDIAQIIRNPTTPARHHLACQVVSWGGEVVTTVYVHVAIQGRSLYLEVTTTALKPCAPEFRIVDTVDGSGTVAWWRAVKDGLVGIPATIVRAPVNLLQALVTAISTSGSAGPLQRGLDYGARVAVRELGSRGHARNLVQLLDIDKYQRLIERRVFAAVLDFLDGKNVDTTEYRARTGGRLNIENAVLAGTGNTFHGPVSGRDSHVGKEEAPR